MLKQKLSKDAGIQHRSEIKVWVQMKEGLLSYSMHYWATWVSYIWDLQCPIKSYMLNACYSEVEGYKMGDLQVIGAISGRGQWSCLLCPGLEVSSFFLSCAPVILCHFTQKLWGQQIMECKTPMIVNQNKAFFFMSWLSQVVVIIIVIWLT